MTQAPLVTSRPLRVAIPNKGALSEKATVMLAEAGYRTRSDRKELTIADPDNDIEFFFLRPKDIAIYVGSGRLDAGITGRDLAIEAGVDVSERLSLAFGRSQFRWAAPTEEHWSVSDLAGKRIASAYPRLVRRELQRLGIDATVIRLDGAVEISIHLGVADCIADIVETGRSLKAHGLAPFGDPLCSSEAILIERSAGPESADGGEAAGESLLAEGSEVDRREAITRFAHRLQGVVYANHYVMLDYDCPKEMLDEAVNITPGLESPTVSPLADDRWVAVRALVPRTTVNALMDRLHAVGAKAILASDVRIARI